MAEIKVIQNTFEASTIRKLLGVLNLVSFDQPKAKIVKQLEELSPGGYLWAVCNNPAYFVQYQVKSAAIINVNTTVLIVWKPKYIEYPSMVAFPEVKEKKLNSMVLDVAPQCTLTDHNTGKYISFLENFYATYFHNDPDFETNFVTYSKHFVSKISSHQYWHAILDDTNHCYVTHQNQFGNYLKVRISGIKDGYDKTIILFSYQGKRDNIFVQAQNKWIQIVGFIAMLVIFYSVVACPSDDTDPQGICVYKQELTLGGTMVMLSMIGVRYRQKTKKKSKQKQS